MNRSSQLNIGIPIFPCSSRNACRAGYKDVLLGDAIARGQDQQVRIESVKLRKLCDCCIRFGVVVVSNGHENALWEPPLNRFAEVPPPPTSTTSSVRLIFTNTP